VIKKLYPDTCFFLFDLPTQLYVCEQYLSSIFPDSVFSFRDTKNLKTLPKKLKGKIFIFGTYMFPILEKVKIDLFLNSGSFQEMEPHVVLNYLKYINENSENVFLCQRMIGKQLAESKGQSGVLNQTKFEHYESGLSKLKLIEMTEMITPFGNTTSTNPHHRESYFTFWKRNKLK